MMTKSDRLSARFALASGAKVPDVFAASTNGTSAARAHASEEEREILVTSLISRGSRSLGRGAAALDSKMEGLRIAAHASFLQGNPARVNQQVVASSSNSSAHGFIGLRDAALYDLFDEMPDKDTTIRATLEVVIANVLRRDRAFVVTDETDTRAIEIRAFVEDALMNVASPFSWEDMLYSAVFGTLVHGFSVNEIIWDEAKLASKKKLVPWGYLHRHPGSFGFSEIGELWYEGINENGVHELLPDPGNKFAVIRTHAPYANPFGQSALYALRHLYWFKKEVLKAALDFVDTYGVPLAIAKVDARSAGGEGASQNDEDLISNLETIMRNLRRETGIILANGEDLTFVNRMSSMGKPVHLILLDWLDRAMVRLLLGSTMSVLEPEHASRAQAIVHGETSEIRLKPLAQRLERYVNACLVAPLVALNFGESAPAPRFVIDIDDPVDAKARQEIMAQAIANGVEVSKKQYREELGLTVPEEGEEIIASSEGSAIIIDDDDLDDPKKPDSEPEPEPMKASGEDQASKRATANVDADVALNGAQVTSMVSVATAVANGELPRTSGIAIIQRAFNLSPEAAAEIVPKEDSSKKPEPPSGGGSQFSKGRREDRAGGANGEGGDGEDGAAQFAARRGKAKSEARRKRSAKYCEIVARLGVEVAKENRIILKRDVMSAIDRLRDQSSPDAPLPGSSIHLAHFDFEGDNEATEIAVVAARMIGAVNVMESVGDEKPELLDEIEEDRGVIADGFSARARRARSVFALPKNADELIADLNQIDPQFGTATRWMLEREVASVAEIREMARAMAATNPLLTQEFLERGLRREVLAIAQTTRLGVTKKFQQTLAGALDKGSTASEFIAVMDETITAGQLPAGLDPYLENVYRTEMSNAAAKQREELQSDPDIDQFLWGFELFNPEDDRSRPSHSVLDGLTIRKGSSAHVALAGGPPFSYQCRCDKGAIMVDDPSNPPSDVKETDGALGIVLGIERF